MEDSQEYEERMLAESLERMGTHPSLFEFPQVQENGDVYENWFDVILEKPSGLTLENFSDGWKSQEEIAELWRKCWADDEPDQGNAQFKKRKLDSPIPLPPPPGSYQNYHWDQQQNQTSNRNRNMNTPEGQSRSGQAANFSGTGRNNMQLCLPFTPSSAQARSSSRSNDMQLCLPSTSTSSRPRESSTAYNGYNNNMQWCLPTTSTQAATSSDYNNMQLCLPSTSTQAASSSDYNNMQMCLPSTSSARGSTSNNMQLCLPSTSKSAASFNPTNTEVGIPGFQRKQTLEDPRLASYSRYGYADIRGEGTSRSTPVPSSTRNQLELVSSRLQVADPRSYSRRGNIVFDLMSDSDSDTEGRKAPPRQRPPPPRARPPPPPRVMICKFCNSDFKGKPQPVEAFVSHLGLKESLECMFCAERFGCEQGWIAHCKRVHLERFAAENPECHLCNKVFGTRVKIINHLLTHSKDKIFMCRMCNQTYRTSRSLFAHLTKAENESPKPKKTKENNQNTPKCEARIQDYPGVMESIQAQN